MYEAVGIFLVQDLLYEPEKVLLLSPKEVLMKQQNSNAQVRLYLKEQGGIVVSFDYTPERVQKIKTIAGRR